MKRTGKLGKGVVLAAFASGPAFLLGAALTHYISIIPAVVPVSAEDAPKALLAILVVTGFGTLISLVPIALAATILARLADRIALARSRLVWAIIALGLGLAGDRLLGGLDPPFAAGLIAACLFASLVCRSSIRWTAEEGSTARGLRPGPWGEHDRTLLA